MLNRAPGLILANVNYVKKVVFPLEILPLQKATSPDEGAKIQAGAFDVAAQTKLTAWLDAGATVSAGPLTAR